MLRKLTIMATIPFLFACTQEQQNQLERVGVTWLEGNYKVTFVEGNHTRHWEVRDGKVTSSASKGYYYFWDISTGKRRYIQTPIARTYIEEIN